MSHTENVVKASEDLREKRYICSRCTGLTQCEHKRDFFNSNERYCTHFKLKGGRQKGEPGSWKNYIPDR